MIPRSFIHRNGGTLVLVGMSVLTLACASGGSASARIAVVLSGILVATVAIRGGSR